MVKISRECIKSGPWQHQQIKWINVWDQEIQQEEDIWRRNAEATDHLNVSCGKATSSVLIFFPSKVVMQVFVWVRTRALNL